MLTFHKVYGLRIVSDLPIPGLRPCSRLEPDLRVHMGESPAFLPPAPSPSDIFYTSPYSESGGEPALRVANLAGGACVGFFYADGARYAISRKGDELWADWPTGYAIEDAATYLVGPVLGFVLRLKGITPLHASCVAIDDRAVAFVGVPGAGKSTTAAAFARMGFSVMSDDIAPLRQHRDEFLVLPGYPRVNLWPDSVRTLMGSENALPQITPTWGKHFLPLGDGTGDFESRPLPLGAVYFLAERNPESSEPVIEAVPPAQALLFVVANTYVNYVLDRSMREREFNLVSELVERVPMRRIYPSADPGAVLAMCEALARDARRHMEPAPAGVATGAY